MNWTKRVRKIFTIFTLIGFIVSSHVNSVGVWAQESTSAGVLGDQVTPTPELTGQPTTTPFLTPTQPVLGSSPTPADQHTPTPSVSVPMPTNTPSFFTNTQTVESSNLTPTPIDFNEQDDAAPSSARIRQRLEVLPLLKANYLLTERVRVRLANGTGRNVSFSVTDQNDKPVKVRVSKELVGGAIVYDLAPGNAFAPGKYTLTVADEQGAVSTQDFTWGVLAINTNKPVFKPNETASIQMAVLDDAGEMVCDANVSLQILSESANIDTTLTTEAGDIRVNPECYEKSFTLIPDYEAQVQLAGEGNYHMILTAQTDNGSYTVRDSFRVLKAVPFEIERSTVTRIYPPEIYPVAIAIKASQDFVGTIKEIVPADFSISELEGVLSPSQIESKLVQDIGGVTTSEQKLDLMAPFEGTHPVSLGFGEEYDDRNLIEKILQKNALVGHDGVDFDMPSGTKILATDTGEVIHAGRGQYGNTVVIRHGWGESVYGHLSTIDVSVGSTVGQGDTIARSGNSGISTGPHLHFGIKPRDGNRENGFEGYVDPVTLLGLVTGKSGVTYTGDDSPYMLQVLTWDIAMKAGQTITIGYSYNAPDESPQFYTLGPLSFQEHQVTTTAYEEPRTWQIAADFVSPTAAIETDATAQSEDQESGGHNMVFVDDQNGYAIFTDLNTVSYRKTTNGGLNWGTPVTLTAQADCDIVSVWYDKWTPGNTGDLIHIAFTETGGDDVYYENIDTANADTQKGEVLAVSVATTTNTALTDSISITRATDGDLYIAFSSSVASSVPIVRKSTDVGSNWTSTADEGLDIAADPVILMPLASDDILLMRWDISAEDIQSKEYEDGGDSWAANWTDDQVDTDAQDSTVFTETWAATVHPSTFDVYLTYVHTAGVVSTPEVRTALYDGSSWSAKTDVHVDAGGTNSIMGASIALDSLTDDVYVGYLWGTSAGANNARFKISSDFTAGSPTWSAERGPIINISDDMKGIHMDAVSDTQIGLWAYNDDTADIFYGQVADLGAHSGAQSLTNMNGFESQDGADADASTGTLSYSTSVFRSGAAALRTNPSSATGFVAHALTYGVNGAVTSTDLDNFSGVVAMRVASGTNINQQTIVISGIAATAVEFSVALNTNQTLSITNDTGVNGSFALVDDTWYVIAFGSTSVDLPNRQEVRIYSNDMTTLHETISQTGQTVADFDAVRIGVQTASSTADIYWDDYIVNASDTMWNFPLIRADYHIVHMALDGAGTDTAWSNDYQSLDEIPTNTSDYVESTNTGEDETSTLESAAAAGVDGTPIAVRVMNRVWETSATVASVRTIRTIGAGTDETTAVDPGTTAGTDFMKMYNTQPTVTTLWTTAALDTLEVGVGNDAVSTIRNSANVTQVLYEFVDSGGPEVPDNSQLMRHGKWFNSAGVEQPFTF